MRLSFRVAIGLAAFTGFAALSYEIVWARIFNFISGSRAEAFGALLGSYLFGLALGALLSRRWQLPDSSAKPAEARTISRLLIAANAFSYSVVPITAWLVTWTGWMRAYVIVVLAAAWLGTLLPLVCHYLILPDERAGARMSYVYLANIMGSGSGSLLTGFLLMDHLTLPQIDAVVLGLAVVTGISLCVLTRQPTFADYGIWAVGLFLVLGTGWWHQGLYERLMYKWGYRPDVRFAKVVEDRHGVIAVDANRVVWGNGVYDGRIDTDPVTGGWLFRPYFLPALQANPSRVLMIGLSGGSWAQIIAHYPAVQQLTAVEISHGYLDVIAAYPSVASLLSNPKVNIVIDDGRRWLRRNPDRQFDAIVMNNTFYWREYSSALLSREFLEMARDHLAPGGVMMWNCTQSARAIRTGMAVFPYTIMVGNNCVGSMAPIAVDRNRWRAVLANYRIDGRLIFDTGTASGRGILEQMLGEADLAGNLMFRAEMEARFGGSALITDDNLGQEFDLPLDTHPALRKIFSFLEERGRP
jgi:hypothetical protein